MSVSLYDILGVNKSNSCNDIKKAYLKLARTHHPDKGGDAEKFKDILRASEILTDENKRRMYDQYGITEGNNSCQQGFPQGFPHGFPQGFQFDINNVFANMFQGVKKNNKPQAIVQIMNVTLKQFYSGEYVNIDINRQKFCKDCDQGVKSNEICKLCNGSGNICKIVHLGQMMMQTSVNCNECQGKGKKIIEKCGVCFGIGTLQEKYDINFKIVPGTSPNKIYQFLEAGSDDIMYEKRADIHVKIIEDTNDESFKIFKRFGDKLQHLESNIVISLAESLIGCVVQLSCHPGYEEGIFIKIPAGSFHNNKYCLSNFGMPIPDSEKYGDLFVVINVTISPTEYTIFTTKCLELLKPIFEDKIRVSETKEKIHTELYIVN